MKRCLFCCEPIQDEAFVCPHCRYRQTPGAREDDKSAERVIGLIDALVRWLGIPLSLIVVVVSVVAGFLGIKQWADVNKQLAQVTQVKNVAEATERQMTGLLNTQDAALHVLLYRTIKLETESVLGTYPLDSESSDYTGRVAGLENLIDSLNSLHPQAGVKQPDEELSLARALIAYKGRKYEESIRILGDPPKPDGVWQRHLLGAAFYQTGDHKKAILHREAMVNLAARNQGSLLARAEQNLAAVLGTDAETLDKGIEELEKALLVEDRATGASQPGRTAC